MPEFWEFPKRTIAQHNTEWLYYKIIAESSGHTAYEIYNNCGLEFLKEIDEDGEISFVRPNTLSTVEHNDYLERIRAFYAERGLRLPDPETNINLRHAVKKYKDIFKK